MSHLNFISCSSKNPKLYLLGIPYDGTSSYRPGSRFAPNSIREASYGLETYYPLLNNCLSTKEIMDLGNLDLPFSSAKNILKKIYLFFKKNIQNKKVITMGGEHLISYPILLSYLKFYPNLILIHFDAHADFREEYLNERYSHATVIRQISYRMKKKHIYQFGIRSGDREEWEAAKRDNHFYPYNVSSLKEVISSIPDHHPIYITLDLDVLDPSVMPGTGTPEPGGLSFTDLEMALLEFKNKNIIGADVVELTPDYDHSGISSITASKIIRQLLLLMN